jgi:hypothetical protein
MEGRGVKVGVKSTSILLYERRTSYFENILYRLPFIKGEQRRIFIEWGEGSQDVIIPSL